MQKWDYMIRGLDVKDDLRAWFETLKEHGHRGCRPLGQGSSMAGRGGEQWSARR